MKLNSRRTACRQLVQEHPTAPIMIATGCPGWLFGGQGLSANALLRKPLDVAKLRQTIHILLPETPWTIVHC